MTRFYLSAFADEADPNLDGQLDALSGASVGLLEIRGVDGKNVMLLSDEEALAVRAKLDAVGVKLSALGSPIGKISITDPFEPHRRALERAIELCAILGTKKIRMFSFFIPKDASPESFRDEVFSRMGKMIDLAERRGVSLIHENEKGIYGDTADRCLELLEAFPGRLGCVFDPANFIQCGEDTYAAYEKLARHIDYMHIKDALRDGGAVVPCGAGDGQIERILAAIAGAFSEMTLTVEPHLTVFEGLQNIQHEELTHKYTYPNARTAFQVAVDAIKAILNNLGFKEEQGGYGAWTR